MRMAADFGDERMEFCVTVQPLRIPVLICPEHRTFVNIIRPSEKNFVGGLRRLISGPSAPQALVEPCMVCIVIRISKLAYTSNIGLDYRKTESA